MKYRRQLMTCPGFGALTTLTFKTNIDDPARFSSSKRLSVHFGLTPGKHKSA
jgi:transposase